MGEELISKYINRINEDDIFAALGRTATQVRGGYAFVTMIAGFGIVAFRVR